MRLFSKTTYLRAKGLSEFQKILEKFDVDSFKDLKTLNFYFVIDYVNISDIVNYDRIFPNENEVFDFAVLIEEQKKLFDYINNKNKKNPEFFQKLGALNEVTGCYLVVTSKSNIKTTIIKNSKDTLVIKFKKKNLPTEFNDMCDIFYKEKQKIILKEQEEFENFIKLSPDEQNAILQDILKNVQIPSIILLTSNTPIMKNINNKPNSDTNTNKNSERGVVKLEDVAADNISNIDSVDFLYGMLRSALENENYEVCAKVRDRVLYLTGQNPII